MMAFTFRGPPAAEEVWRADRPIRHDSYEQSFGIDLLLPRTLMTPSEKGVQMTPTSVSETSGSDQAISCDHALQVARLDAEKAYRDLSPFLIHIVLAPDGRHLDDDLKNLKL